MRLRLLAAVLLAGALSASGGAPLTVTAPSDGEVLRGGSVARIAWTVNELPRGVVEWEAFLSVDGGRYFATRITPHLDIDIREFEWRVPNVSSGDVRLLIRIGDEVEEKSVDVPLRLSIVADPGVRPSFTPVAKRRGESARPGDPGVAVWATGDRGGREVGELRALPDATLRARASVESTTEHGAAEAPVVATPRPALSSASAIAAPPRLRASSPLLARDILVLVRRRNL